MSKVLRVNQIKLRPDEKIDKLKKKVCHILGLNNNAEIEFDIVKKSIDSRHKPDIFFVYSVDVKSATADGKNVDIFSLKYGQNVSVHENILYSFPERNETFLNNLTEELRPVVVGFGPAGIFCALKLAESGLKPIIFERGQCIDERNNSVRIFWEKGELELFLMVN